MENIYSYDGLIEKIDWWRKRRDKNGVKNLHWTQMSSKYNYGTHLRYEIMVNTWDLAEHLELSLEDTHLLVGKIIDVNELKQGIHKYYGNSRIDYEGKSSSWKSYDSFIYETDPDKCEKNKIYWLNENDVIKLFAYLKKIK